MARTISLISMLVLWIASTAPGITIEQVTPQLGTSPGDHWTYDSEDGSITVKTASTTHTYIFWAHEDGEPDILSSIRVIALHESLTSGTVKVMVAKIVNGQGVVGATNIGGIAIDDENVTSIL